MLECSPCNRHITRHTPPHLHLLFVSGSLCTHLPRASQNSATGYIILRGKHFVIHVLDAQHFVYRPLKPAVDVAAQVLRVLRP